MLLCPFCIIINELDIFYNLKLNKFLRLALTYFLLFILKGELLLIAKKDHSIYPEWSF